MIKLVKIVVKMIKVVAATIVLWAYQMENKWYLFQSHYIFNIRSMSHIQLGSYNGKKLLRLALDRFLRIHWVSEVVFLELSEIDEGMSNLSYYLKPTA